MKTFRTNSGPFSQRPHFEPAEIDRICDDELRKAGLYPASPQAIRIDRFIEKRFGISHEYQDLPEGVLGYTRFTKVGVDAIIISAALENAREKVAARRVRTTLAHEAGHGLLHAYLFAFDHKPGQLFDADSHADHTILCRDVKEDEGQKRAYDGRWWEYQANRAMGGLLCPKALVHDALKSFMRPIGSLGAVILDEDRRGEAIRAVAEAFDVNPVVARIRINEMFPPETGQLLL